MDYQRIYSALMHVGRNDRQLDYAEKHHATPKCMGGDDSESNLVSLTAREHYVAHLLLVKMFPGNAPLIYAAHMMTVDKYGHRIGNRRYEWLRRKHAAAMSNLKRGNKDCLGRKHSEETRAKIRAANKGQRQWHLLGKPKSAETRARIAAAVVGKKRSASQREKISNGHTGATPGIHERPNGKFVVRRYVGGVRRYVGFFKTFEEARLAYERAGPD